MIKVLAIVPAPHIYGLQIMTLRFFEVLSSSIASHFLLSRWSDGEFAKRLIKLDIPYSETWFGMFSRKLDRHNLEMTLSCVAKLPTSYWDVIKLVRTWRPDIIYMSNYHELVLLWPVLLLLRIPVVCHVHNLLPMGRFYKCSARIWGFNVSHYVAVSESVRLTILEMGVAADRVSLVYNGVDPGLFQFLEQRKPTYSERFGWSNDAIVVGMTGQMTNEKGHEDFIDAAKIVVSRHPEVKFVIGGKREGPYYKRLEERASAYNLKSVVRFSGWQDNMVEFYSAIDIHVLPTRTDEPFGLVLTEAMATGLPVIATRGGGVMEIVEDGVSGVLVERQNPVDLAEAICSLISSRERRIALGKRGRERVETHFDLRNQSRKLESILTNVARSFGRALPGAL